MTLGGIRLATGPVNWGVDFAKHPDNPPWEPVLDEIQHSGLGALELGPVGYLPTDPDRLREALDSRELTAVGSFVFESLHDPSAAEHVIDVTRRACNAISAAGGNVLVIIDRPGRERAATAGCSRLAPRLTTAQWLLMVQLISRITDLAREHGLQPAFHPHAGSYVEFPDEIDRVLADTDVGLCLDTGHSTYAGTPAHEAIQTYAARIAHIHLKDLDPRVLESVQPRPLTFWEAVSAGVFCPLGSGAVVPHLVAQALERAAYAGFATIEQDRIPGSGTPLADLRNSIAVLTDAGFQIPNEASAGERAQ
jgi:inosose dehydratase